jgi:hypothetical protein
MPCSGHGECQQGRKPCRTPITCSGAPVDEAIEHFRLHRTPLPIQERRPTHKPHFEVPTTTASAQPWTEPDEIRKPEVLRIAQAVLGFIALGFAFVFIAHLLS